MERIHFFWNTRKIINFYLFRSVDEYFLSCSQEFLIHRLLSLFHNPNTHVIIHEKSLFLFLLCFKGIVHINTHTETHVNVL